MREEIVYLDSSAIVKRYIEEPGSDVMRSLYLKAYSGDVKLSYSVWNIGEVLGAFDRARTTGRIDEEAYKVVKKRFLLETRRMARVGLAIVVPLSLRILKEGWRLIEKHHIYEADAVQIASAKYVNASQFLTGDRKLYEVAVREKLSSTYLG